jgi:predicted RNase H-like HicB family nuclease
MAISLGSVVMHRNEPKCAEMRGESGTKLYKENLTYRGWRCRVGCPARVPGLGVTRKRRVSTNRRSGCPRDGCDGGDAEKQKPRLGMIRAKVSGRRRVCAGFASGSCQWVKDRRSNILLAKRHPRPHFMGMSEMTLRVVLYREDGLWVAHSLEMDVIGTGQSREDALAELKGNVEAQLSFARFKNISPFRNAPDAIQRLWEKENLAMLGIGAKSKAGKPSGGSNTLRLSGADVSRTESIHFQCA